MQKEAMWGVALLDRDPCCIDGVGQVALTCEWVRDTAK